MIEILAACHMTRLRAMCDERRHPAPLSREPSARVYLARMMIGFAILGAMLVGLQ